MDDLWLFLLKNRFFPLLTGYLEENLLCKAGSEIARHPAEGEGSHFARQTWRLSHAHAELMQRTPAAYLHSKQTACNAEMEAPER